MKIIRETPCKGILIENAAELDATGTEV